MTIFIFLASNGKGDQGLVITNDRAPFVKGSYIGQNSVAGGVRMGAEY